MFRTRLIPTLVLAASLATSPASHALPLLAQNAAQNVAGVLTLFPDHENSNLFYYMPNSSAFVTDASTGMPEFGLTYWGLDPAQPIDQAGAYMVFSMQMQPDTAQKAALDSFIAAGHSIAVLPIESSTIGLNAWRSGGSSAVPGNNTGPGNPPMPLGKLFEEFDFAAHGGLADTEIGVNAILTGLGAKVFKAAVDNPALLKIDYCYMIQGLGPDFDATIDIDWLRVYDDFQAHASGGGWFFRWQVDAEVEKLRQNNNIHIQVNGGTAADEEYVRSVADKIVAQLFVAELQAQPTSGGNDGNWSFSRLSLKETHREELKTEHWQYQRRDLVQREFCNPIVLNDIARFRDRLVRNADRN